MNAHETGQLEQYLLLIGSGDPDDLRPLISKTGNQESQSIKLAELSFPKCDQPCTSLELVSWGRKTRQIANKRQGGKVVHPKPTDGFGAVVTRYFIDSKSGQCSTHRLDEWRLYSTTMIEVPVFTQEPTPKTDLQNAPTYEYVLRPGHEFEEELRETATIKDELKISFFVIRNRPEFFKGDPITPPDVPYTIAVPANGKIHPRTNQQSAISAYNFFEALIDQVAAFGIKGRSLLLLTIRAGHFNGGRHSIATAKLKFAEYWLQKTSQPRVIKSSGTENDRTTNQTGRAKPGFWYQNKLAWSLKKSQASKHSGHMQTKRVKPPHAFCAPCLPPYTCSAWFDHPAGRI